VVAVSFPHQHRKWRLRAISCGIAGVVDAQ